MHTQRKALNHIKEVSKWRKQNCKNSFSDLFLTKKIFYMKLLSVLNQRKSYLFASKTFSNSHLNFLPQYLFYFYCPSVLILAPLRTQYLMALSPPVSFFHHFKWLWEALKKRISFNDHDHFPQFFRLAMSFNKIWVLKRKIWKLF
jgi:hypothetical protein